MTCSSSERGDQAVDSRQIDEVHFARSVDARAPDMLLDCYPGKFATFCRSPVSRLKRVDLPEFGGPTSATVCRWRALTVCRDRRNQASCDRATVAIAHDSTS